MNLKDHPHLPATDFKRVSEVCASKHEWNSPWSLFLLVGMLGVPAVWYVAPQHSDLVVLASIPLFTAACNLIDRDKGLYIRPYFDYLKTLDIEVVRLASQSTELDDKTLRTVQQFLLSVVGDDSTENAAHPH
ncbi:hypothetical protein [Geopseudomonas aromaticivorans]